MQDNTLIEETFEVRSTKRKAEAEVRDDGDVLAENPSKMVVASQPFEEAMDLKLSMLVSRSKKMFLESAAVHRLR